MQPIITKILALAAALAVVLTGQNTASASASSISPKIIGGVDASLEETPWHIGVLAGKNFCGGSAISETVIVTAAHCFTDTKIEKIKIFNDASKLDEVRLYQPVQNLIVHPEWNAQTYRNDIALLITSIPLVNTQPVSLPINYIDEKRPKLGEKAQIAGWGATQSKETGPNQILQKAEIEILTDYMETACGLYSNNFNGSGEGYDNTTSICAGKNEGGVDSCQGDSGGGLTIQENGQTILAGVVSVGFECAQEGYPGIYTRVSSYLDWIDQNTGLVTLAKTKQEPNLAEITAYITDDKALQTQQLHNYAISKTYTASSLPLEESIMSENKKYYLTETNLIFTKKRGETICIKNYDLTTLTETEECVNYKNLAKKKHTQKTNPYISSIKNTTQPKKLWKQAYKNKLVKKKKMPKNFTKQKKQYNKIIITKPNKTMKIVTRPTIANQKYTCTSTVKISGKKTRLLKTRCT